MADDLKAATSMGFLGMERLNSCTTYRPKSCHHFVEGTRVRQAAVKGQVVIRLHGISGEEELQDRLAEERARWCYPQWWLNCEWHLVKGHKRSSKRRKE